MASTRGAIAAASLLVMIGCRKRAEPRDAAPTDPTVVIAADRADELRFVDLDGRIRHARGVAAVPVRSRHAVATEGPDGPGGALWIADVSRPAASWPAQRGTRRVLERRGLAGLPPGAASRLDLPPPVAGEAPPASGSVVVYGASWCGACDDARAWLTARKVSFTFRDVELDPGAARDASQTCAALGVPGDRVPVIDVAGRVVVGFDPVRLTTILGQPI